jgi:hypothetical protein
MAELDAALERTFPDFLSKVGLSAPLLAEP